jgi:hypothetical protein
LANEADRRKHPRLACRVPLYIVIGSEIFQKMVELQTQNVSEGGLAFETHREIPLEGEALVMVSRLGDLPSSAQIQGRVVHCREDAARGVFSVGIAFDSFRGVTAEELKERIEAWRARTAEAG